MLVLSDLWPPFPGGAERLIFNVARDLQRRDGFELEVITGYENAMGFDGPPVKALPIGTGPDRDAGAAWVSQIIRDAAPDVILTHHYYASQFRPELVGSGVPLVQIVLNGPRIAEAALAVFISQWVRDQFGDAQPQDIVMTPPAFDDIVAAEHGHAIGFIKPIAHKGVELVYDIAAKMPDRRFVILRGEWQDIEIIRPAANIEFMEPVVDIRDFYARCRLVLMPSRSEDAGTVAQECARNGIPCISSPVGGLAETNAGGVLLPLERPGRWVGTIRALDQPGRYRQVVDRQRAHLAATDHGASLDLLAQRIAAL